jgi:hypothetical protein
MIFCCCWNSTVEKKTKNKKMEMALFLSPSKRQSKRKGDGDDGYLKHMVANEELIESLRGTSEYIDRALFDDQPSRLSQLLPMAPASGDYPAPSAHQPPQFVRKKKIQLPDVLAEQYGEMKRYVENNIDKKSKSKKRRKKRKRLTHNSLSLVHVSLGSFLK